jgi:hypothetical protein
MPCSRTGVNHLSIPCCGHALQAKKNRLTLTLLTVVSGRFFALAFSLSLLHRPFLHAVGGLVDSKTIR